MKLKHRTAMINRGFTLIELLVVVAIIVVLMALLVPSLTNAREQAKRTACASNLRQLGAAIYAYASEYNGEFPSQYWYGSNAAPLALVRTVTPRQPNGLGFLSSLGYLGVEVTDPNANRPASKVLKCPSYPSGQLFAKAGSSNWCSYLYQSIFMSSSGATSSKRKSLLTDVSGWSVIIIDGSQLASGTNTLPPHIGNTTNALFSDGHSDVRPWKGPTVPSWGWWTKDFDTAKMEDRIVN